MRGFLKLESRDVVVVVALAMFMVQLDASTLAISLPKIAQDFGVPTVSLSLSITIYLTMLVAVLPISGWAADRFGPRRVFLIAIVGFATFSVCCALSSSFWPFIIARAFQGASASLLAPVGRLIMLKQTSKKEMVDALSITAMPMLIAPTIGPTIGGFMVEFGRWEYIFLLNVPVAIVLFAITYRRIPVLDADKGRKLDWLGALLLGTSLITLLTGFDRLSGGIGKVLPWSLMAVGLVLSVWTIRHLKTHPHPIVALDALKTPAYRTAAIGSGAVIRLPARALLFVLPLMFQIGFGLSPFFAGLMLMALSGGDLLTKPFVRPLFDRFGYARTIIWASFVGLAASTLFAIIGWGGYSVGIILFGLFAAGISRSLLFSGMASLSFTTLEDKDLSSGNVMASISMQLMNALTVSAAALGLALASQFNGRVDPTLADFRITIGVIVVIGVIATFRLRLFLPKNLEDVHAQSPDRPPTKPQ